MPQLDFGCGSGGFDEIAEDRLHLQSWLTIKGGPGSYGIDINPERIETAKKMITNGTKFICCNGLNLPFPDNYFDVIHEFGVLHHMPDYRSALKELHRVAKPGCKLIIKESVDNDPVFWLFRRILGKWQGDLISSKFTSQELDQELSQYFFIDKRQYYWRFTLSDLLREYHLEPKASLYFNHYVSKIFQKIKLDRQMCSHYVVNAVKRKKIV